MMKWTEQEFRNLAKKVDNAGRWGDEDELGTLNFITPAKRVSALRLAVAGEVVNCADPWRTEVGSGPLVTSRIELQIQDHENGLLGTQDHLEMFLHGMGSPAVLKALNHVYFDGTTYNRIGIEDRDERGIRRLAVYPGPGEVVTRGVLLDLPAARDTPFISADSPATLDDIEESLRRANLVIEPGDALFIRTGLPLSGIVPGPGAVVPGLSIDSAEWFHDSGVSLVVTDGGMDVLPSLVENVFAPWHILALTRMGLRFVVHADLEALARHAGQTGRYEFAAVVSFLPIPHATGVPVSPLAIF
jgi:kynurenine formamidase